MPELYFREGKTDSPWEARTVSRRLRELHEEEGVPYADMAILMRTMGSIQIMLQALKEEGVPVKVVDGRDFYNRQDMRDLLNLLPLWRIPIRTVRSWACCARPISESPIRSSCVCVRSGPSTTSRRKRRRRTRKV